MRQVADKYLVQDRSTGGVYETPQFMYIMIALTIFAEYPKQTRLNYVRRYYDAISKHKLNIPTPIMAGVRTPIRQFASCVLVDIDDTLDSIFSSDMAIGKYVAQRAGIGINAGRIRGINSKIRGGEVQHTGVVPFLKKFESTVRCCTQNGIRGGSATVHFPIWHQEIRDILVLKNNKGTEDNRVRKLDYSIQLSKLFYERFIGNQEISLFSPHDVPGLYESFGTDRFDDLYKQFEKDETVPQRRVSAQALILDLLKERAETGRIYIMNIDHCNSHSSFKDKVTMSNLCQEITLPTTPLQHIDDPNGEIALCILSAINIGTLRSTGAELEELCDLSVRGLDALIDFQGYPVKAAEMATFLLDPYYILAYMTPWGRAATAGTTGLKATAKLAGLSGATIGLDTLFNNLATYGEAKPGEVGLTTATGAVLGPLSVKAFKTISKVLPGADKKQIANVVEVMEGATAKKLGISNQQYLSLIHI